MKPTEPLALHHSWPLIDCAQRFDLGLVSDVGETGVTGLALARPGIGQWACDLRDDALTWSGEVFDLFGVPRGTFLSRAETVRFYREASRAAMERLRAHAIKHRRGFTLDAEIIPGHGSPRWMRLTAAPICQDGRVVRLHGLKQDVTALYR